MDKPQFEYNGLRNFIYQGKGRFLTMGQLVGEDRAFNLVKALERTPVIMIYCESENKFRERIHDNYVNCSFTQGLLTNVSAKGIFMSNGTQINIDDLLDVIPQSNVRTLEDDGKLKQFTFYSTDVNKSPDIFEIIHADPVRAFLARDPSHISTLYLGSINELQAGMQHNTIRNK